MKVIIPAGSILVMPKGNARTSPLTNSRDLVVDPRDVKVYRTWGDYIRGEAFALVKHLDPETAVKVALRKTWPRYGLQDPEARP